MHALILWLVLSQDPISLELDAGDHVRRLTPIQAEVTLSEGPWRLVREDGRELPMQIEPASANRSASVWWILEEELAARNKRRYRLEPKAAVPAEKVERIDDGNAILLRFQGRKILQYHYKTVEQPNPTYSRSGYIHPVWNPSGQILSNDSPRNHLHHHGIWFSWSDNAQYKGHKVNFWEAAAKVGRVECTGIESSWQGPVGAGFRARHRFLDISATPAEQVLEETWTINVYAIRDFFLFDLTSTQICTGQQPLLLKKYRYGGIGFRGSPQWEGKDGVQFTSSEGHVRGDAAEGKAAKWAAMYGKIEGTDAGIAFLCHPSNFRFPQNMRMHPSEPFFNYTPCQAGDMELAPGKPYVSRYRYFIPTGTPVKAQIERLWADFAEPPQVTVVR